MGTGTRRRSTHRRTPAAGGHQGHRNDNGLVYGPVDDLVDGTVDYDAEVDLPGWGSAPATLNIATKLLTGLLWAAVIAGPLLGLAALAHDAVAPAGAAGSAAESTRSGAAPAGIAALYVGAWLSAGNGAEDTVRAYYPQLTHLAGEPNQRSATRLVPVAANEVSPGYWSVTVAAQVAARTDEGWVDTGLHYYQVGIRVLGGPEAGGEGKPGALAGYAATGLPAEVGPPAGLEPIELGYPRHRATDVSDPVAAVVSRFLAAYLLGDGELARYVSPGSTLVPITPPPYAGLTLRDLFTGDAESAADGAADAGGGGGGAVDRDGTRLAVLVTVEATDRYGTTRELSYALTLTSRDGRWEVSALDPAPALADRRHRPAPVSPPAP